MRQTLNRVLRPQILLGERAHLIEFPSLLLPPGVTAGSIVNIAVHQNHAEEKKRDDEFWSLQDEILETFGKRTPEPPKLNVREISPNSKPILKFHSFETLLKQLLLSNGRPCNSPLRSYVL